MTRRLNRRQGNPPEVFDGHRGGRLGERLRPLDVREIRHLYALGVSQYEIVRIFAERGIPITQCMISYIVNRKRWRKVP